MIKSREYIPGRVNIVLPSLSLSLSSFFSRSRGLREAAGILKYDRRRRIEMHDPARVFVIEIAKLRKARGRGEGDLITTRCRETVV
jgi:hypothetical protein